MMNEATFDKAHELRRMRHNDTAFYWAMTLVIDFVIGYEGAVPEDLARLERELRREARRKQ